MQMCKTDELECVRGITIGSVFEKDGLRRQIDGIKWREREHTWYVQWSRQGSQAGNCTKLSTWMAWVVSAKKVFDLLEGSWCVK
jgi:hypothetical protein